MADNHAAGFTTFACKDESTEPESCKEESTDSEPCTSTGRLYTSDEILIAWGNEKRKAAISSSTTSEDSEDGSSFQSPPPGKKCKNSSRFPVTKWRRHDLEEFGVFYGKDPVPLTQLFNELCEAGTRNDIKCTEYPSCIEILTERTSEAFTFSIDASDIEDPSNFDVSQRVAMDSIDESFKKLRAIYDEIDPTNSVGDNSVQETEEDKSDKKLENVLTTAWYLSALRFLNESKMLIRDLTTTSVKTESSVTEFAYTNLIMEYSKIFFLEPEHGKMMKSERMLRGKKVSCIPDVRFRRGFVLKNPEERPPKSYEHDKLAMLIEVKCTGMKNPSGEEETWIEGRLTDEVLGQIGAELLMECAHSSFYPEILGIACMKTEIIFMVLKIKSEHLLAIVQGKSIVGKEAQIAYTRSYNVWNADDRKEISAFLTWLASVQIGNFRRIL